MLSFRIDENIKNKMVNISTIQEGWPNKFLDCKGDAYDRFLKHLNDTTKIIPTGILPSGVRFISTDRRTIIWEVPPQRKLYSFIEEGLPTIRTWTVEQKTERTRNYSLPIPWTLFLVRLDAGYNVSDAYLYFTGDITSINTLDYNALPAPLHNIYADGRICFSEETSEFLKVRNNFSTIRDILAGVYDAYWNSISNIDTSEAFLQFHYNSGSNANKMLQSGLVVNTNDMGQPSTYYNRWEKMSLKDALNIKWGSIGIDRVMLNAKISELAAKEEGYINSIIFHQITSAMKEANKQVS